MTSLETIILYVGFGIAFLFFLAFVNEVLTETSKLFEKGRQNENIKKK